MPLTKRLGPATRDAYGKVLAELGATRPEIVVLDADLAKSTRSDDFRKRFPDRFFNVGISEANLVGIAGGLAASGKVPFISSFACFLMCKGYDQLRMAIAYPRLNVKVVGSHGGISAGEDGASQMSIEDVALATSLPGFTVVVPADAPSAEALTRAMAAHPGPVYIRTGRPKAPIVHEKTEGLALGKGVLLRDGTDLALIANGLMVWEALEAADRLQADGVRAAVADLHTIKPLDEKMVADLARRCGAIVCAEEHQVWGGLGSAVARAVGESCPVPIGFVGIADTYAESGDPDALLRRYGLTADRIVEVARKTMQNKRQRQQARAMGG
ncbi:MAG: transketolase family protein [Planctomycetes bacterium]|nr:transketolase family protein [Planctomycetota bacterium]